MKANAVIGAANGLMCQYGQWWLVVMTGQDDYEAPLMVFVKKRSLPFLARLPQSHDLGRCDKARLALESKFFAPLTGC